MERPLFSDVTLRTSKTRNSWFRCRTRLNQYSTRGVFQVESEYTDFFAKDICLSAASTVCDGVMHCPDGSDELCVMGLNRMLQSRTASLRFFSFRFF